MSTYLLVKHFHVTFALLSLLGFTLRGYWMMTDNSLLNAKPVRVLPHINDSMLLLTAIVLVLWSRQYPLVVNWLTLKVSLLVVYIALGSFALKRAATREARRGFLIAALIVVLSIFVVAVTKPRLWAS